MSVVAALSCLLLVPAQAAAEDSTGFAVSPLLVETNVSPGGTKTHTLTVTNTTTSKLTFTVSKEDVAGNRSDPNANPVLLGGKVNSSISGYDWITELPSSVSVSAGDSKDITVKVKAPSDATGGHYAAVTLTSGSKSIGDVSAQSRVAVLFMMNAGGVPPPEIVIEDVVVTEDGETIIEYVNEGDREVQPEATVTYVDAITGQTVAVRKQKECSVALPGGAGRCVVEALGTNARGSSLLTKPHVELASEGRTAKAELPTEWSGTWSSLVLPFVGLGLLVLFFVRRRRRSADYDDELLAS